MSMNKHQSEQLDAEIKLCIEKNGPISGYGIIKCVQAPPMTVRFKLKRMVELGELDCQDARKGKVYSLPLKVEDLPDSKTETAPRMVSRGPQKPRISPAGEAWTPTKLYSSGRPRRGKSMAAMAFEGNGARKE